MAPTKSIVIITGSTRTPRVGPHVAEFVEQTIQEKASLEGVEVSAVDLAEFKLPVYDEPAVPAMIPEPDKYTHEHSRRWAQEIARHDGYVLVSPEYNYGMPGGVKNAIDYLFHPWKGKPIAIVTYGLNGGKTSSEQLEHTLSRMGLQVASTRPQLAFSGGPSGPDTGAAMMTGDLGKVSLEDWTQNSVGDILKAFDQVREAVLSPPAEVASK
ncbi:NADPH-dependent FMN reductase [Thozetella sp. PMI_491]|nr:NADPH-dependent FMN reductase [Thozetella sp. PMI_491]